MKYAILGKLGGELIAAVDADYDDYKGFLRCPECKEPVFLRKSFIRNKIQIPSAFVHHKAIPEVSNCELRVSTYTIQDIENISAKAKGQRLKKLQISLWKYLKYNSTIDLRSWSKDAKDIKKIKFLGEIVNYGMEILKNNTQLILDSTLPQIEILLVQKDPNIRIIPGKEHLIDAFIKNNKSSWTLHCKIASEALNLFLSSHSMKEIRYRLLYRLCHPTALQIMPELLTLDIRTVEWKEMFSSYLVTQTVLVFLTVGWIKIFDI